MGFQKWDYAKLWPNSTLLDDRLYLDEAFIFSNLTIYILLSLNEIRNALSVRRSSVRFQPDELFSKVLSCFYFVQNITFSFYYVFADSYLA